MIFASHLACSAIIDGVGVRGPLCNRQERDHTDEEGQQERHERAFDCRSDLKIDSRAFARQQFRLIVCWLSYFSDVEWDSIARFRSAYEPALLLLLLEVLPKPDDLELLLLLLLPDDLALPADRPLASLNTVLPPNSASQAYDSTSRT